MITYDVFGYLPGQYRALPATVTKRLRARSFPPRPGERAACAGTGEPNTDPYRPTPDELYARGKAHFDAGRFAEAAEPLEPLFAGYTLTRRRRQGRGPHAPLDQHPRDEQPRKIVQYFEVVKEKAPELVLTFDQLLAIGKAYRDINEYERAMIVWRGLIEASYLDDARVGELLRQRGKTLEAIAYLIDLWRSYPNTASIESDFFGLSQIVAQTASQAFTNPGLRRELAAAGVTRSELLLQSIRMIQVFLAQSPRNPVADEASLALLGAFTDLEDFKSVDKLAARFARLYPKSTYQDSFQYSEALANFHLGQYDRAIEVAQTIATGHLQRCRRRRPAQPQQVAGRSTFLVRSTTPGASPARRLEYYRQVADRFNDAAGAIQSYTRKELKVPEVSVVRADSPPVVVGEPLPRGFRVIDVVPASGRPEPATRPGIGLDYRNIGQVDVKVYPVI